VSSHLRFITAASLIVFGGMIGVGAVALLPTAADRTVLANAATSDLPATPCKQSWLPFDRSCVTKRDLPWTAGRGTTNGVTGEPTAEVENAAKPPVTEGQRVATAARGEPAVPTVPAAQSSMFQPAPQATAPQDPAPRAFVPQPVAPQSSAPQASTPPAAPRAAVAALPREPVPPPTMTPRTVQRNIATPAAKAAAPRPTAKERVAAKAAVEDDEAEARPAKKKAFRPERTARRPTNECGAEVWRQSARDSRDLLCRRWVAARHHHPADVDPGRVLLLRAAVRLPIKRPSHPYGSPPPKNLVASRASCERMFGSGSVPNLMEFGPQQPFQ
jgi:hypothetical protein